MVNPNQRISKSEEGFLDQSEILLKKKVLLNIITEEDAACIKSYISEIAATRNISSARRFKITSTLANSRRWLKTPFRQMTTPDLYMGIDAIQNDPRLDQHSIGDIIRYLKEISLWLIENGMAPPGLRIEKVKKIVTPAYTTSVIETFDPDPINDHKPQNHDHDIGFPDNEEQNSEIDFLVTVAKIFNENKKYDLAKIIAEYCVDKPRHQRTCLNILMRCAYSQKDFIKSLEYVDKLMLIDPRNSNYQTYKNQILLLTHSKIQKSGNQKKSLIEAFFFTHNGGVRTINEDSLLIGQTLITDVSMERPETIRTDYSDTVYCVADGIGGEEKGEVASLMVLSGIREHQDIITDNTSLSDTLYLAKKLLDTYVLENPDAKNLGCTLSGICFRGDTAIVFNVGDCRVYRINEGRFEKITRDHSLVQTLYEEGIIQEHEMRQHPKRNIITSSVSGDGLPDSIKLFSTELHLRNDDMFFICSDGIWECFSNDELEMIYQKFQGFKYCETILSAALARKAKDNISAILIQIA